MNLLLGIFILIAKILENALATLRLIVVSNGKKKLGAFLNGVIAFIWVISTGLVIIDIKKDILRVVFFILGSIIGSYVGSLIEEKLALGDNLITVVTNKNKTNIITKDLKTNGYGVTILDTTGTNREKNILLIFTSRKRIHQVVKKIKKIDHNAMIMSSNASYIYGNFRNHI